MRLSLICSIAAVCIACRVAAQVPESIPLAHRAAISSWFSQHSDYRIAKPEDCECDRSIEDIWRGADGTWAPVPSYQPYLLQGDFDGDGIGDVAIVAVTKNEAHKIVIVVSVGNRNRGKPVIQAVPDGDNYLQSRGLFCSLPYPQRPEQRCHLLFGAFHSEAREIVVKQPSIKHP